ncbi:MAG: HAAS signaling domain-containing protein [Candidatus Helarchaeota archaeon]
MSENEKEALINQFLEKIKNKLPEWLKEKKDEVQDILDELQEHVYDKATELSSSGEPTYESVREAIAQMGSPSSIAREYKRRGTPMLYISKELFPIYYVALEALFIIVIAINAIVAITSVTSTFVLSLLGMAQTIDILNNILTAAGGTLLGGTVVFTTLTILFIWMSMEGYLPEDFQIDSTTLKEWPFEYGIIPKPEGFPMPHSVMIGGSKHSREESRLNATSTMERTSEIPETAAQEKESIRSEIELPEEKPVKMVDQGGAIFGGIFTLVLGYLMLLQPILILNVFFHPEFLFWLRFFGVFALIGGGIELSRGILGNHNPTAHEVLLCFNMFVKIASIPFIIVLFLKPYMMPMIWWYYPMPFPTIILVPQPFWWACPVFFGFAIFFTIIDVIMQVVNILKLEYRVRTAKRKNTDFYHP